MKQIQGKLLLVRVSEDFELPRARVGLFSRRQPLGEPTNGKYVKGTVQLQSVNVTVVADVRCSNRFASSLNCFCFVFCLSVDRKVFLATWKDIPTDNEVQTAIYDVTLTSGKATDSSGTLTCIIFRMHMGQTVMPDVTLNSDKAKILQVD